MTFSRQEHWSGLPFPSPGDLPDPGIEPGSPTLQADALPSETPGKLVEEFKGVREGVKSCNYNRDSEISKTYMKQVIFRKISYPN